HLGHPVHGVDVLSHGLEDSRGVRTERARHYPVPPGHYRRFATVGIPSGRAALPGGDYSALPGLARPGRPPAVIKDYSALARLARPGRPPAVIKDYSALAHLARPGRPPAVIKDCRKLPARPVLGFGASFPTREARARHDCRRGSGRERASRSVRVRRR